MNIFNRVMFLSCLKATEAIEKEKVVGLNFLERAKLHRHIQLCKACELYANFSNHADLVIQNLTQIPLNQQPKSTLPLEEKILQKIFIK